jgi:hypothetical protein
VTRPKTYYRDESDSDVSGILVVEEDGDEYRVMENRLNGWCAPFWMPEPQFRANTHSDSIKKVGRLPDQKFERVLGQTDETVKCA